MKHTIRKCPNQMNILKNEVNGWFENLGVDFTALSCILIQGLLEVFIDAVGMLK